jgi:hypothetical protein
MLNSASKCLKIKLVSLHVDGVYIPRVKFMPWIQGSNFTKALKGIARSTQFFAIGRGKIKLKNA